MTAFTQEQLNAKQTVNNAVKYDSLTAAQKNSVLDVLDSIQNDTSSDKIDSADCLSDESIGCTGKI